MPEDQLVQRIKLALHSLGPMVIPRNRQFSSVMCLSAAFPKRSIKSAVSSLQKQLNSSCSSSEWMNLLAACFAKAFQRVPQSLTGSINSTVDNSAPMMASITSDITGNPLTSAEYEFIVSLEIREKVTKNAFTSAPRDRSSFRLRCNTDKQVSITVKQTQSNKLPTLYIERCFGVLLSPGKLVRQADMRVIVTIKCPTSRSHLF